MDPVRNNLDGGFQGKGLASISNVHKSSTGVVSSGVNDPVVHTNPSPDAQTGSQRSLFAYAIFALGLALFIRFLIATPYVVIGASMEPTFDNYHYLIIDRLTYRLSDPQRGDVIVLDLPQETSRALIKRVIGLPGETVVLANQKVEIINATHSDGFVLDEPYLDPANVGGATNMRVTLGPDQYFVLGDNRRVSADSRAWGVLPRADIVGRALLRLYPVNAFDILPGAFDFTAS